MPQMMGKRLCWVWMALWAVLTFRVGPAVADDRARADQLQSEGNALAKDRYYEAAIAKFKEGQRLVRTWMRTCNIGMIYQQMGKLPQAELFLRQCKRASKGQLPAAVVKRIDGLVTKLRAGPYARVVIDGTAGMRIRPLAFPVDETVGAGEPVWLALGTQRLTASKPGMSDQTITVELTQRGTLVRRQLELTPRLSAKVEPPPVKPLPPTSVGSDDRAAPRSRGSLMITGGGVLLLAAGGVFHALAVRSRDRAEGLPAMPPGVPYPAYDSEVDTFEKQRAAAIGFYAAGAVVTGVGLFLMMRSGKARRRPVVSATPLPGGAAVFAQWSL